MGESRPAARGAAGQAMIYFFRLGSSSGLM